MMQPKKRIKRRDIQRRHVPAAADAVVDLVVHVLEAAELAGAGARVPPVEAEGVKVGVRQ